MHTRAVRVVHNMHTLVILYNTSRMHNNITTSRVWSQGHPQLISLGLIQQKSLIPNSTSYGS